MKRKHVIKTLRKTLFLNFIYAEYKMKKEIIILAILILSFYRCDAKSYYEEIELNFPNEFLYQPIDISIEFKNECYAINENEHSIKVIYNGKEIESQIYNLEFNGKYLKKCNIVFLYHGKGKYIVKYGNEIRRIRYEKHVSIEEKYYSVEPVKGYSAWVNYYEIRDDGNPVFAICQEGDVFGIEMANKVIKLKGEFNMNNWEKIFSFAFFCFDGKYIGSDEKLLGKKILIDGNLMTRIAIESISSNGKVKTKAIYTYYHSPSPKIFVRLRHEARNCKVGNDEQNGIYAYILSMKIRSKAIKEINAGEILPYIHLNGRYGIEEYRMEENPENKEYKWILSSKDNIILGDKPWLCIDGKGKAYGLILSKGEYKIKALVKEELKIPGLEVDGGGVSVGRVQEGDIDSLVYNGVVELFCGKSYMEVEKESEAFFKFFAYRNFEIEYELEEEKKYKLTIVLHSRFSISNKFYIEAEVYKGNEKIANKVVKFRKVEFEIPEGEYAIKIFSNGIFGRKYVGFGKVLLDEDKKLHILCTFQGKIVIVAKNGTEIKVVKDNCIVSYNVSNGKAILYAPSFKKYKIQAFYKGVLLYEKEIYFIMFYKDEINFKAYNLTLYIKDKLGFPFAINITPVLVSNENIYPKKIGNRYVFNDLPKGNYVLRINYRNFEYEEKIEFLNNAKKEIIIPIEYRLNLKFYDSRGFPIKASFVLERGGKEFSIKNVPPGSYVIKVYDKKLIAKKKIFIENDESIKMLTNKKSIFPLLPFFMISFIILIRRRINIEEISCILLSLSLAFPWWYLEGKEKIFLFIFPPEMLEFYDGYGNFLYMPEKMMAILIFLLVAFFLSFFLILKKFYKISLFILIISAILFIFSMNEFTIGIGSIIGKGYINNEYSNWGFGIGFYLAIICLILISIKVVINEIRRSG